MTNSQPDCLQSFIGLKMQHIEATPHDFTRLGIHMEPVLSHTSPFHVLQACSSVTDLFIRLDIFAVVASQLAGHS